MRISGIILLVVGMLVNLWVPERVHVLSACCRGEHTCCHPQKSSQASFTTKNCCTPRILELRATPAAQASAERTATAGNLNSVLAGMPSPFAQLSLQNPNLALIAEPVQGSFRARNAINWHTRRNI